MQDAHPNKPTRIKRCAAWHHQQKYCKCEKRIQGVTAPIRSPTVFYFYKRSDCAVCASGCSRNGWDTDGYNMLFNAYYTSNWDYKKRVQETGWPFSAGTTPAFTPNQDADAKDPFLLPMQPLTWPFICFFFLPFETTSGKGPNRCWKRRAHF